MTQEQWLAKAASTIKQYQEMKATIGEDSGMLREVKWQYQDMAQGGDGGRLGFPDDEATCRSHNYPGYPDIFFKEVCCHMGWRY